MLLSVFAESQQSAVELHSAAVGIAVTLSKDSHASTDYTLGLPLTGLGLVCFLSVKSYYRICSVSPTTSRTLKKSSTKYCEREAVPHYIYLKYIK